MPKALKSKPEQLREGTGDSNDGAANFDTDTDKEHGDRSPSLQPELSSTALIKHIAEVVAEQGQQNEENIQ